MTKFMSLREIFSKKKFVITAELPPPKGTNAAPMLDIAKKIYGRVDGVNVTDNQRAVMRMSSMAFSHLLKEQGIEPIMQMCCRDKNRLALQSEVLGAYSLGIRNICVMTGDHPVMGDNPDSRPVFDLDSVQLIDMIKNFTKGGTLSDKKLDGAVDFYIGGVVNPSAEPFDLHMMKLKKKAAAGADFFQTQPLFDIESIRIFLKKVKSIDAKFLIGVVPLKSLEMADFLNKNILSKPIPEMIVSRLRNASHPIEEGINITGELIDSIKGLTAGVHLMPIGLELYLPRILEMIC